VTKMIVVGVDFSSESEIAARQSLEVARHTGAEVVLAHACFIPEFFSGSDADVAIPNAVTDYRESLSAQLDEDRDRLESLRETLTGQGVEVSQVVIDAFPDTGLCEVADKYDAELIIVGTHGRTGIKRFFLGSVAEKMVRMSKRNVLVVRSDRPKPLRKLMVPVDFYAPSKKAIAEAVAMAPEGATVEVVHFWQLPMAVIAHDAHVVLQQGDKGELAQLAAERGDKLIEPYKDSGVNVVFRAVQAPPSIGIVEHADGYDCIVMGSHGRRGVRRLLLGSVAETTVRHAPCSVLVVHPEPGSDEEK